MKKKGWQQTSPPLAVLTNEQREYLNVYSRDANRCKCARRDALLSLLLIFFFFSVHEPEILRKRKRAERFLLYDEFKLGGYGT